MTEWPAVLVWQDELLASVSLLYSHTQSGLWTAQQPGALLTAGRLSKVCPHQVPDSLQRSCVDHVMWTDELMCESDLCRSSVDPSISSAEKALGIIWTCWFRPGFGRRCTWRIVPRRWRSALIYYILIWLHRCGGKIRDVSLTLQHHHRWEQITKNLVILIFVIMLLLQLHISLKSTYDVHNISHFYLV